MNRIIKILATILVFCVGSVLQQIYIPSLVKNYGGLSPLPVIILTVLGFTVVIFAIWSDEIKINKKK